MECPNGEKEGGCIGCRRKPCSHLAAGLSFGSGKLTGDTYCGREPKDVWGRGAKTKTDISSWRLGHDWKGPIVDEPLKKEEMLSGVYKPKKKHRR